MLSALKYLRRYTLPTFGVFLLLSVDWGLASLASCAGSKQQQTNKCAEEYYGLTQAIFSRFLGWLFDAIDSHHGLVTAAATIAIAWFTWTLRQSTDQLRMESEGQRNLAKETAERQLRAYVYLNISGRAYPPPPNLPDRASISLEIINGGKTWAQNLVVRHFWVVNPKGTDPFADTPWGTVAQHSRVLGPEQRESQQFCDIGLDEFREIAAQTKRVYFMSWITYQDVLSDPPITRQTQLFRRLNTDNEGGISFSWMPTHNCADDGCPK